MPGSAVPEGSFSTGRRPPGVAYAAAATAVDERASVSTWRRPPGVAVADVDTAAAAATSVDKCDECDELTFDDVAEPHDLVWQHIEDEHLWLHGLESDAYVVGLASNRGVKPWLHGLADLPSAAEFQRLSSAPEVDTYTEQEYDRGLALSYSRDSSL